MTEMINQKKSKFMKENKNKNSDEFCDVLSIPSNPEDLFTLLYPIGHGAFGSVYKAKHNSTNKVYAIKIIDYSKDINLTSYNYFSVQQETTLMKLVNKSNYIVKYYGSYYSRKSNNLWLILEYCSSGSAIDLMLSMERTFSEVEIATIMEMVLEGLVLIHSKNLIHRDIKGANILLSEDGYAKLGDFGVGVQLMDEKYRQSKKGSPYWMSPQVASNLNYDFKTDIWSLGITCVELVEGEPPFSNLEPNKVMEKISKKPPKVDEIINLNEHTYEFKSFIEHCLEIDPNKRYTAQQLLKHEFITKFTKGRKYMINLIKSHISDVEKYRIDSEKEYQKIQKINEKNKKNVKNENAFPEEVCDEDIFFKKVNYNGTGGEYLNLNFESLDNKMDRFIKKNREKYKENEGVKNNELNHKDKKEEKEEFDESMEIEMTKKDCFKSPEKENIIYIDKNNIKIESNNKNNNSSNSKMTKDNDSNKSLNGNECFPMSDLLANVSTEHNSKRTNSNEESNKSNVASAIKEKKNNIQPSRDLFKIFENNNVNDNDNACINGNINDNNGDNIDDDKKSNIVRTPSIFKNNPNDISYINNKENDENIDDSDDEEITNKSNGHNNYFKSLETYLKKERDIYCEKNTNKNANNNKIKYSF